MKKILFIVFGGTNKPSSRYRVFQYLDHVYECGRKFQYKVISTPQKAATRHYPRFLRGIIHAFNLAKFYFSILFYCIHWADKAFIQKTILPKIVIRLLLTSQTPFIYDFDDAIYVPFSTQKNLRKRKSKVEALAFLLRHAETVIVGNQVLEKYALQFRSECELIPTVIDLQRYHVKQQHPFNFIIGWIGTSQNLVFLDQVTQPLKVLRQEFPQLKLLVICDKPYELDDMVINKPWGKKTEIDDMLLVDIGIMPLSDDEWTRGKCSFKAIQYMALGIPAILSPVGMNAEIIKDGVNGYLADTEEDWIIKLRTIIVNQSLRQSFAVRGREQVETNYSLQVWINRWCQLLLSERT